MKAFLFMSSHSFQGLSGPARLTTVSWSRSRFYRGITWTSVYCLQIMNVCVFGSLSETMQILRPKLRLNQNICCLLFVFLSEDSKLLWIVALWQCFTKCGTTTTRAHSRGTLKKSLLKSGSVVFELFSKMFLHLGAVLICEPRIMLQWLKKYPFFKNTSTQYAAVF